MAKYAYVVILLQYALAKSYDVSNSFTQTGKNQRSTDPVCFYVLWIELLLKVSTSTSVVTTYAVRLGLVCGAICGGKTCGVAPATWRAKSWLLAGRPTCPMLEEGDVRSEKKEENNSENVAR